MSRDAIQLGFQRCRIWQRAFENVDDSSREQRLWLRSEFLSFRKKAEILAAEIARFLPEFTVHDVTHMDALWEVACEIAGDSIEINPLEAFVLGGAFLIHDLGMSAAAYADGIREIESSALWPTAVRLFGAANGSLTDTDRRRAIGFVLREQHAAQAENMAVHEWRDEKAKSSFHLIADDQLRVLMGPLIGRIGHSHWWPIDRVFAEFEDFAGYFPGLSPQWRIDAVKLACLLRVADAAHLDARRAPAFLAKIRDLEGLSKLHWHFQGLLLSPVIDGDKLHFSGARAFKPDEAKSWWLAYDAIRIVDAELRGVDDRLGARAPKMHFAARGVLGAGDEIALARYIRTKDWLPVDARPTIGDVSRLIERLGGQELYGDDSTVALRELLQNSIDAVVALRQISPDAARGAEIRVEEGVDSDGAFLQVDDDGIGMSQRVILEALLNFGTSLWSSALLRQEFPELLGSEFDPTGKFGIGFFAVFMLGDRVEVTTRRFNASASANIILTFNKGIGERPLLRQSDRGANVRPWGTRVRVYLRDEDAKASARGSGAKSWNLAQQVQFFAPFSVVPIKVVKGNSETLVIDGRSYDTLSDDEIFLRGRGPVSDPEYVRGELQPRKISPISDSAGRIIGRVGLSLQYPHGFEAGGAIISKNGVRLASTKHVAGVVEGRPIRAARDLAKSDAAIDSVRAWYRHQIVDAEAVSIDDGALMATQLLCLGEPVGSGKMIAEVDSGFVDSALFKRWVRKRQFFILGSNAEGDLSMREDDPVSLDPYYFHLLLGSTYQIDELLNIVGPTYRYGATSGLFYDAKSKCLDYLVAITAEAWNLSPEEVVVLRAEDTEVPDEVYAGIRKVSGLPVFDWPEIIIKRRASVTLRTVRGGRGSRER